MNTARRTEAARNGAEQGLICAFSLRPDQAPQAVEMTEVPAALGNTSGVVWIHLSASNAAARRWLRNSGRVPDEFVELIETHETRTQWQADGGTLTAVIPDIAFGETIDPSEVVTLWVYASPRLLVTARNHAARSADELRRQARQALDVPTGQALFARMIEVQLDLLRAWLTEAAGVLDQAEDRILIGDASAPRERLGVVRRHALHLRRYFAPARTLLNRALHAGADERGGLDGDAWRALNDEFAFVIDETTALYERAKILQEELASRLAEANGRNLYVLTITTIVFLPMTLLSGIFGMNIAGLPGVGEGASPAAFWWVLALIVASGLITFVLIRLRRMY